MIWFSGLVIALLMGMALFTLVRGIAAFLASSRVDMERPADSGPSEMQLRQNRLMLRRIMFQGAAILVVALLLATSKH